jgi:hypothetical protein
MSDNNKISIDFKMDTSDFSIEDIRSRSAEQQKNMKSNLEDFAKFNPETKAYVFESVKNALFGLIENSDKWVPLASTDHGTFFDVSLSFGYRNDGMIKAKDDFLQLEIEEIKRRANIALDPSTEETDEEFLSSVDQMLTNQLTPNIESIQRLLKMVR